MQEIGTDVSVLIAQFNLGCGVLHRPSSRWGCKIGSGEWLRVSPTRESPASGL